MLTTGAGMGIRVARGRAAGGLLALAGVLALVPSIFWPTMSITQPGAIFGNPGTQEHVEDPVSLTWSWGRYGMENAPEGMGFDSVSNTVGLAFLVLVILVGLAGAVAWLLVRGLPGRLLGVAGTAVVASYVGAALADHIGENLFFYGPDSSVVVGTPPAGVLEGAALVLLAVALAVMLWGALFTVGRAVWRTASARAAVARSADESAGQAVDVEGRGTVIVHGERPGDAPPWGQPADGPSTPAGPSDRASDDERFRPPGQG